MRRNLFVAVLFSAALLALIGCAKSVESSSQTGAPEQVSLDAADSDARPMSDAALANGPLAVGDKAPDFEIEVLGGDVVTLASFLHASTGPTVVLFNRAHW